jgi:hypothetical protein
MSQINDLKDITAVVNLYVDVCRDGDAGKLKEAFHDDARMYGVVNGERADIPITQMIDMVVDKPTGAGHQAHIVSVDQVGDIATAALAEEGFWGMSFVDHFSMARLDGRWRIVNKVFEQTG